VREVLHRGEKREVTLDEELRVLEPYLDISRTRFGDRLKIKLDIGDDASRALVPFFILQPLVENALAHGIGNRAGNGLVEIRAQRRGNRLVLTVLNDGNRNSPSNGEGIGLPNTRARLDELYGDDYAFRATPLDAGGFEVRIELPWRVG
jgi:two-component system LytT family sensor kinase